MSVVLAIFTFVLVLVSLFMVLVILMQRAKSDGGVGAALGGGVTEAAFGAEGGNVLSKATTYAAVLFFVLGFGLYLGHLHLHRKAMREAPPALPEASMVETAPAGLLPPAETLDFPATTPAASDPAPAVPEQTPPAAPSGGGS